MKRRDKYYIAFAICTALFFFSTKIETVEHDQDVITTPFAIPPLSRPGRVPLPGIVYSSTLSTDDGSRPPHSMLYDCVIVPSYQSFVLIFQTGKLDNHGQLTPWDPANFGSWFNNSAPLDIFTFSIDDLDAIQLSCWYVAPPVTHNYNAVYTVICKVPPVIDLSLEEEHLIYFDKEKLIYAKVRAGDLASGDLRHMHRGVVPADGRPAGLLVFTCCILDDYFFVREYLTTMFMNTNAAHIYLGVIPELMAEVVEHLKDFESLTLFPSRYRNRTIGQVDNEGKAPAKQGILWLAKAIYKYILVVDIDEMIILRPGPLSLEQRIDLLRAEGQDCSIAFEGVKAAIIDKANAKSPWLGERFPYDDGVSYFKSVANVDTCHHMAIHYHGSCLDPHEEKATNWKIHFLDKHFKINRAADTGIQIVHYVSVYQPRYCNDVDMPYHLYLHTCINTTQKHGPENWYHKYWFNKVKKALQ